MNHDLLKEISSVAGELSVLPLEELRQRMIFSGPEEMDRAKLVQGILLVEFANVTSRDATAQAKTKAAITKMREVECRFNRLREVLGEEFSSREITLSAGLDDNVHISIESSKFADKSPEECQAMIEGLLERCSTLTEEEKLRVSCIETSVPEM